MKTRITFEVVGSTKADIERRALSQIADFLNIEASDVESNCEIELHIEPSSTENFKATVYVRVK